MMDKASYEVKVRDGEEGYVVEVGPERNALVMYNGGQG